MDEQKTVFNIKEDGFHGALFENEKSLYKNKILIICSGSDGDFENSKIFASFLSKNGINSLALGYFNIPDGPNAINKVPLDYVENASKYLKSIGYEKIGIWGISIGSIYALLSACYFPDLINLVIGASPCYYVTQAMDSKKNILFDSSAFSYKGEEIPYEPYTVKMSMFKNIFQSLIHLEPNFMYLYEPLIGKIQEKNIIPVEKMKARVILFSGKIDHIWPATQFGELIIKRLKDKNYSYQYEHIICKFGGHLMTPIQTKLDKFMKANRQFPKEAENYRKEHLKKLLEAISSI